MHVKTHWTVSIPTLETERLRLRTWQASDFDTYAAFKSDPELQRYFLGGTKNREEAWEDFCAISGQWVLRGIGAFLVADLKTDEPRGFAGFWYPLDIEVPELCWALFPGNMKQGFATEAASAARQWLYTTHAFDHVVSYIHPDNAASCALAERLGARFIKRSSLYGLDRLVYQHPGKSGT
mgnify:FL=1